MKIVKPEEKFPSNKSLRTFVCPYLFPKGWGKVNERNI